MKIDADGAQLVEPWPHRRCEPQALGSAQQAERAGHAKPYGHGRAAPAPLVDATSLIFRSIAS